ncbi:glycoside hydrolase family 15 protein [Gordonia liuliyuniae]|uniref:Glycoside hydrolase family 15 protein n=1 Tax=Gordonia liuliyuniae TaxID=2911517 RepID=A0ABS9IQJ5_9ACTN|nr:glycoside hydrolase family 15 protein [Gordonia liuliyuniae]MCF8587823.1 glycoside hydrolase family 15 protein [Gordonia liuliyuniae]
MNSVAEGHGSDGGLLGREPRPNVLREYAFVADGERGALIGPGGDIGWMCAPRWDSSPLFDNLLGGRSFYEVRPAARFVWGGAYEPGSLVWHSRWVTGSGTVECVEALAYPGDEHRAVLLRQVRAVTGPAHVFATLTLDDVSGERLPDGLGWAMRSRDLHCRWSTPDPQAVTAATADRNSWQLTIMLAAGESCDLEFEVSDRPLPRRPDEMPRVWESTRRAWSRATPDLGGLCPTDARQSYAVMRGLTHRDGGTVAAVSTSMPERPGGSRNYDYRYVWIRDTSYCGIAAAVSGDTDLLAGSAAFVAARLREHGESLSPAYTVGGADVPSESRLGLPGYPGGSDRIGNWVRDQFQLDEFGEALSLFAHAARADCLGDDAHRAVSVAAEAIETLWQRPDAGIWEIENRRWTHSRLACVAGLRATADAIDDRHAEHRRRLADHILAETTRTSLTRDGRWQRADDDPGLDGALLEAGLRGAVDLTDPRSRLTLDAYLDRLTLDGYAYRFAHGDDPLGSVEGSFVLCGFWVAQSLHSQQRYTEAQAWFERIRCAYGPGRLYSEEFDAAQHQLRGNLPQAFVHASMIESSLLLDR